jgi:enediyne biosynthesis protein E4
MQEGKRDWLRARCSLRAPRRVRPFLRGMSLVIRVSAALLAAATVAASAATTWRELPESGRWAPLSVPPNTRVGFTQLQPESTGLWFTNTLAAASSAANRVLENGSGVALGDFDRDGLVDVFLCGLDQRSRLFRNLGGWKFADWTAVAGLDFSGVVGRGAVFADLDGDRWPDLLVSTLDSGVRCFRNNGQGGFDDVTGSSGLDPTRGTTTLTLADVDGNGTLDLYVAHYRAEDIRDQARVEVRYVGGKPVLPPHYQDRLVITPTGLLEFGEPDRLYLNDGRGAFTAVAWTDGRFLDELGRPLPIPPRDWGLTASFRDLNGDGAPDLYVCNDYWAPDRIWINDGKGGFRLLPRLAIRHTSENSMGVDFADLDRDGQVDGLVLDMLSRDPELRRRQVLAQTPMSRPPGAIDNRPQIMRNVLFHNRGDGTFAEIADYAGLSASDWSWQPLFLDVDLDGYEDVLIPAGHTRDVQDLDATARIRALQHPWPKTMDAAAAQQQFTREMMEHARLYPELPMPVIAFRNLGNLRFEETTAAWGTETLAVHQGIAAADLDGDGDLDLVVNNLNSACGVYRNDGAAPRVAVRLNGHPPNTYGIGARVTLVGGAVERQTQEMICGGRYLSGSEALLVFAAGTGDHNRSLEVVWRNGQVSRLTGVRPNRIYEIDQASARTPSHGLRPSQNAAASTWFEDVSHLLGHRHHEREFDDFSRQPLLSRRLSQPGPGVAWSDLDDDGDDDLMVASGAGGRLAVYRNTGRGTFEPWTDRIPAELSRRDQSAVLGWAPSTGASRILIGSDHYEDGLPNGTGVFEYDLAQGSARTIVEADDSSVGALALADLDGDGDLDLFVGGRVLPGRYPEPASSRVFRREAAEWREDHEITALLRRVGLVNGATWSDLDGDGLPELLLACEWGPIRIFGNRGGTLHETTEAWGMEDYRGWWSGIATGDFDGDGKLDIVAGNWGENSPWRASSAQPLRLVYADFADRGMVDLIETEYDARRQITVPYHRLDYLCAGLPMLLEHYDTSMSFSQTTVDELVRRLGGPASEVTASILSSMVFLNRGGHFEARALPQEAQWAPAFGVTVADYDGDGADDIFLSQNFFALRWEMPRLDAGRGLWLRGNGCGGFAPVPGQESGVTVYGEQRGAAVADFDRDGRVDLLVSQNAAETKLYRNQRGRPGLRVRLQGPPGNPTGVGATVRLRFGDRLGPAREVRAGSGYWSQDSAVLVLGCPEPPDGIWVRWPGGRIVTSPLAQKLREVTVHLDGRVADVSRR